MIKEKMLELLILDKVIFNVGRYNRELNVIALSDYKYDWNKLEERYKLLVQEFLEPYVIESYSKE